MVSSVYNNSHLIAENVGKGAGEVDCEALGIVDIVPNKHIYFQTLN